MLRHFARLHAHPLDTGVLMERLALHECGRTPYRRLSGGQQQRLGLALALIGRPELVAMTKADLPDVQDAYEETKAAFAAEGIELRLVSAATHEGLDDLMHELSEMLML